MCPADSTCDRMLNVFRTLVETGTPEQKQAIARDFRICDGWPPEQGAEGRCLMERNSAGGIVPPSWGHGPTLLERIKRY